MKKLYFVFLVNLLILDSICIIFFIKFTYNEQRKQISNNPISKIINNVCEIKVDGEKDGIGTGVYIGNNEILTCNHLVENTTSTDNCILKVKFYKTDNWHECTIKKSSETDDLLLLEIEGRNNYLTSITFSDKDNIVLGMEVYSIGNTLGNGLSVSKGIVSCAYKKIIRSSKKMGVIQTNISIENGDSGGPVFNDKGEIVGINSFRLLDVNGNPTYANSYAISIKEIREFLNDKE